MAQGEVLSEIIFLIQVLCDFDGFKIETKTSRSDFYIKFMYLCSYVCKICQAHGLLIITKKDFLVKEEG